jgi:hypothetical protein
MRIVNYGFWMVLSMTLPVMATDSPFASDPDQILERTCFQTGQGYTDHGNLRSDVAIVYGIDPGLPGRIQSWRDKGYRIHVMTGVSWGNYQDYLYGRFDGINHEDEAQTERSGKKVSHGGDVYYMCPGTNYGKFLSVGVQRALDAGAEAIHLEEPEFWVHSGYSEGFKREWKQYYGEDWQPPYESADAQWRSAKLKYFLYRRALQQVFDHVQDYNTRTGRHVRCYVPTHSLINYATWRIVSPESSLARLKGCDGYIAQVWTGTSRTPNVYRGLTRERTFETAFLEYGAMQNLVRSTGRSVWYLNDPIEDNPDHDWTDYRVNWESTLVASLFQPDVAQYEVAPWPERIFGGKYPHTAKPQDRKSIPPEYATELQTVMNTLNDMKQNRVEWDCGTAGLGVFVSDSLMFQRGHPFSSDEHLSHFFGLALPLLKRGMPVTPVQLENVTVSNYLAGFKVLVLTYHGMKPLSPDVHAPIADWVRQGGVLVMCDNDGDPYLKVREWWGTNTTPRTHLFAQLGIAGTDGFQAVGKGGVLWLRMNPATIAQSENVEGLYVQVLKTAVEQAGLTWRETNYLLLRRGPYVIASGLDESVPGETKKLQGRFVSLFDSKLAVQNTVELTPGSRQFLLDLDRGQQNGVAVLASACKALPQKTGDTSLGYLCDGVAHTPAVILMHAEKAPSSVTLDGKNLEGVRFDAKERLLWVNFENSTAPRELRLKF